MERSEKIKRVPAPALSLGTYVIRRMIAEYTDSEIAAMKGPKSIAPVQA